MHRIFVSYRRSDNQDATGRIYDRLTGQFGKGNIFKDVDSIPLGADFRKQLGEVVGQCRVLIVVLGANWLDAQDENGKRRLDSPNDFVRIEIEAALARGIPVIPVLVGNALMPAEEDLPPSLSPLVYRQGIQVRADPDFHRDMDRLIASLQASLVARERETNVESEPLRTPQFQAVDESVAETELVVNPEVEGGDFGSTEPSVEELQSVRDLLERLVTAGIDWDVSNLAPVSRDLHKAHGGREVLMLCELLKDPKTSGIDKYKSLKLLALAIRQPHSRPFQVSALDTLFDHGVLSRTLQRASLEAVKMVPAPPREKWARLSAVLSFADEPLMAAIVDSLAQVIPPSERQSTGAILVELLDGATDWSVVTSICRVLQNIGYRAGVAKLISLLEWSPAQKVASISTLLISWQVIDATPAIRQAIENWRYGTDSYAPQVMKNLYALEGSVASPYLAEVLRDAQPPLQRSILDSLSDLNDSVFVDVVADLATNSLDEQVRTKASEFLQKKRVP
jgi:hypothetical protein